MEVATTSQMILVNIIFEWFLAKCSMWLCFVAFRWLKMTILRDEVQAPHQLFRTLLPAVAATPADLFGPTSAGCTAKGGVSTSTACSVAVVNAHQPKRWSLS
jgi:hypothetical protein